MAAKKADKSLEQSLGISRASRKQYRRDALTQPKSKTGAFLSRLDPETRKAIILEAPERILRGESTTAIANSYGIPPSTIRSWLIGNEQAEAARGAMLGMELAIQIEAIENATDTLSVAKAREAFRAWSWIAERREARLYGQKQEVTHNGTVTVSNALQTISERRLAQLDGHVAPQLTQSNIIDVHEIAR